jgi:hypothetical protein
MKVTSEDNLSIHMVASQEQKQVAQYGHLNTIYRILAVVKYPQAIGQVSEFVWLNSPLRGKFRETNAVAFVSDALKCALREPWPGPNNGQDNANDGPKSQDDANDGRESQDDANN